MANPKAATFMQRYGMPLKDLVKNLIFEDLRVEGVTAGADAWMHFNDLLNQAMSNEKRLSTRAFRRAMKMRTYEGAIVLGLDHEIACKECAEEGKEGGKIGKKSKRGGHGLREPGADLLCRLERTPHQRRSTRGFHCSSSA